MRIALKFDLPIASVDDALFDRAMSLLASYELRATVFLGFGESQGRRWFGMSKPTSDPSVAERVKRLLDAGHELGVSAGDSTRWCREVLRQDAEWVRNEIDTARDLYRSCVDSAPAAWASPGQQINADVPLVEAQAGFRYACDTRGLTPYLPQTVAGRSTCPQIPVTLPDFAELQTAGIEASQWDQYLFMESQKPLLAGHVFQCELAQCDSASLDVLEKLIVMWKGSQWDFVTLGEIAAGLEPSQLPCHEIGMMRLDGRELATQGPQCR